MKVTIEKANEWAMMSCSRWCKSRRIRDFNRGLYLALVETAYKIPELKKYSEKSLAGDYQTNSYPWPFVHPDFANWEEEYNAKDCTLVLDRSGCIVKHDTSYIAWKIYESTGEWPRKTSKSIICDLDWIKFLSKSGYHEMADEPIPGHKYVGIYPIDKNLSVGLWYETTISDLEPGQENENIIVSTYIQKRYTVIRINSEKVSWIKIK